MRVRPALAGMAVRRASAVPLPADLMASSCSRPGRGGGRRPGPRFACPGAGQGARSAGSGSSAVRGAALRQSVRSGGRAMSLQVCWLDRSPHALPGGRGSPCRNQGVRVALDAGSVRDGTPPALRREADVEVHGESPRVDLRCTFPCAPQLGPAARTLEPQDGIGGVTGHKSRPHHRRVRASLPRVALLTPRFTFPVSLVCCFRFTVTSFSSLSLAGRVWVRVPEGWNRRVLAPSPLPSPPGGRGNCWGSGQPRAPWGRRRG